MNSECHHQESLNQVTTPSVEGRKLHKIQESLAKVFENSWGELFERCFAPGAVDAFEAEEYQRLTELAAKCRVSIDEIKEAESFLKEELPNISRLQVELAKDVPFLRGKNRRKEKRRFKRNLAIMSEINIALTAIVRRSWCCLSPRQKEYLENLTTSLAALAPDGRARVLLKDLQNFRLMSPVGAAQFNFYLTTTELIQAVVDADDADAELMEDEDFSLAEQFVSFLDDDVVKQSSELVPYTEEMDLELSELLGGIEVD
jgi:hypothetical protein